VTDRSAVPFAFHGATLLADASGALVWPEQETLVVADLHLEKGSAFAVNGTPLPPYDSRETLRRLGLALRRHRPRRVICLGDSFHDTDAADRLADDDADPLRAPPATASDASASQSATVASPIAAPSRPCPLSRAKYAFAEISRARSVTSGSTSCRSAEKPCR